MKVLFVAGASPATLFALAPLGHALRNAGDEVIISSTDEMAAVAERTGLPFATVTDRTLAGLLTTDRQGRPVPRPESLQEQIRFGGAWFGRLAAASIDQLLELASRWRPDLVVGGTCSYAAGLLCAHLGVPHVRQAWDALDNSAVHGYADEELAPELAELGLKEVPPPDLFLDVCPPSLRAPGAPPASPLRWTPGNQQRAVEPWMLARTGDRPRVCLTSGSRVSVVGIQNFVSGLAEYLDGLDVEIVVAAPDEAAAELRERMPGLRVGWIPLDVLMPTCDLVVHHGGGVTSMTALSHGVPQLVLPDLLIFGDSWRRLADHGAGIHLPAAEAGPGDIAGAARRILDDPAYRSRAAQLSAEIATMPCPDEQLPELRRLALR